MTYKKTWLSYLLWALYTCAAGVILADYTILFWQKNIKAAIGYDTIIFVFLVFAGVAGCYFLIRKTVKKGKKYSISSRTALLWEVFIVLCILFAALLYRVYLYLQSAPDMVVITQYYRDALVTTDEIAQPKVHGASYLYTMCLSVVFSFLGNKTDAAIWLQIFLQIFTVLLSFFTVKKLAGIIPACVTMFVLAVSSVYTGQIFVLTSESMFFLFYMAGLLIIGSYIKMYCGGTFHVAAGIAGAIVSGAVIGILCYLDAISFTLLIFMPALFTGVRTQEKNIYSSVKITASFVLLILASGGLSFMGMLVFDAFCSQEKIGGIWEAWFLLYQSHIKADYIFYQTERSIIECLALVIPAAFLIMAFWNRKNKQNATFWIGLMFILAPTPLTATGVLSYQSYSVFIWSVLAGIGIQQSFVWEDVKVVKTAENVQITEEIAACEPSAPAPRFLENPLPLPKKHEKKTMDYQYEIAEDKMNFDVEIKENDDFDIL